MYLKRDSEITECDVKPIDKISSLHSLYRAVSEYNARFQALFAHSLTQENVIVVP